MTPSRQDGRPRTEPSGTRPGPGVYQAVPSHVDLPTLERSILDFWREHRIFERVLEETAGRPRWVFYEGPPTANGLPGAHHVEARVFKDVFPRFKTMKGYHVPRRAGWDCHGLPVELAVEKELGFTTKGDIETYGIAEFNARCRESVERHVDAFRQMTERMGYWVDMSLAYRTMDPSYMDSVWWSLKAIYDRGLLVEDHRVTPYCPRCGTGLSDHEVAQGYETVVDPAVYVRLAATSGPLAAMGADLLVWTTTPWTLVANTAVAVHPDVIYAVVRGDDARRPVVVAESLVSDVVPGPHEVLSTWPGRQLEGTQYRPPLDLVGIPDSHMVVLGEHVTTHDGTGLVHLAPAYGAEDLEACRRYGLPVVAPIRSDGTFEPELDLVGGRFFKDADPIIIDELNRRGLLVRHGGYEHSYPHCWRCHTPLLYQARPSWYIRTTAIQPSLLRENERTAWHPETIKHGRYGDWLRNNVDWALSRDRYWGTPLPIWRCEAGHVTCVGSRAELGELSGRDLTDFDPHRPHVDEVAFPCATCGATARRVPQVIDVWYDSGSMPFAQWGFPYRNVEEFEESYPAQFIAEGIDQTRGWFYTLMAIGTLVFDRSAYESALCLGIILAEDGRRMSKHLGNVLEPVALMDEHGADAVRWFMLAGGSPWAGRRIGHTVIQDIARKTLLTYWSTVSFQALYGRLAGWAPGREDAPPVGERPLLDRWVLSELHTLIDEVDSALEGYDTQRAGRALARFVDQLSNWYVRRSRRRFWAGSPAALATLHQCLDVLTRLMAPLAPFITERVWQDSIRAVDADAPESVHLAGWPTYEESLVDTVLAEQMELARRVVELGRTARAESKVKIRQPLARALVRAAGWAEQPEELRAEVADELNVSVVSALEEIDGELTEVQVKPNFRALGTRFGARTSMVAQAVVETDPAWLAAGLRQTGRVSLVVADEEVVLFLEDVLLSETPREGWAVASAEGETVALDVRITPELRRAGLARQTIRVLQEARKTSGLAVSDRIHLWWEAEGELAEALSEHRLVIADEVLAASCEERAPGEDLVEHRDADLGLSFWLRRVG